MAYSTIEEKLASTLNSTLSVKAYPMVKKETDNNCVVYQKVSTVPLRGSGSVVLNKSHFRLSVYATSYKTVKSTAKSVWAIDGNRSDFATAWITNEQDIEEMDSKLYRVDMDLWIFWNEGNLG